MSNPSPFYEARTLQELLAADRLSLVDLFRMYLPLNAPRPLPAPEVMTALDDLKRDSFWQETFISTALCKAMLFVLCASATREDQHKTIAGGKANPNRYRESDLIQTLPEESSLPRRSGPICRRLLDELPLLIRLMRKAQRAYWKSNPLWKVCHQAAAIVLLRIVRMCKTLRRQSTAWFTHVCLRWAFRVVWGNLFAGDNRRSPEAEEQLKPLPMTVSHERAAFAFLMREGRESAEPPPPFELVLARWLVGDLPPIPQSREEEQAVRGYV